MQWEMCTSCAGSGLGHGGPPMVCLQCAGWGEMVARGPDGRFRRSKDRAPIKEASK